MPSGRDKQYQKALDTIERLRNKASEGSKGKGKAAASSPSGDGWHCRECGYYNFGSRRQCRICPTARAGTEGTSAGGVGGQNKASGGSGKGSGNKGGGSAEQQGKLLARIKQLEEQNGTLKADLAEKHQKQKENEEEDVELEEEDEEDAAVAADLDNLPALQRCYDATLAQIGADDPQSKALRARLEAARAKQRAGRPILQQVQAAQRKATRAERQLETAKNKLQELEKRKLDLEKEVAEQASRVSSAAEEVSKSKEELGTLLEKAKAEQATTTTTATGGGTSGTAGGEQEGLLGAAAAWNKAKLAIQKQVEALPADASQELRNAIATQYAAMEAVLNKLTPPEQPASVAPPTPAPQPQPPGSSSGGAPAAAAAAPGATSGGPPINHDGEDDAPGSMCDIDETTLARLAEIFTTGDEATDADDGGDGHVGDPGEGDGGDDGRSRKSRRLMETRLSAAKQYLAGRVPLRKGHVKPRGHGR
jgi:hypothetical protein